MLSFDLSIDMGDIIHYNYGCESRAFVPFPILYIIWLHAATGG